MAGMPGIIAKVPISKRVDDLSRKFLEDHQKRDEFLGEFLKALENWHQDYYAILHEYGIIRTEEEERHLRNHWFNENGRGWWRQAGPVKAIHRQGLIEAFREAKDRKLPIDSYWICAAHPSFDVCVCWSEEQVTRIIISPIVPDHSDPASLTQLMPILLVKRGERRSDEVKVHRDADGHLVDENEIMIRADDPRLFQEKFVQDEKGEVITVLLRGLPYTSVGGTQYAV